MEIEKWTITMIRPKKNSVCSHSTDPPYFIIPPLPEGGILFYLCPSKIFFSVTVDGRNLIFGDKRQWSSRFTASADSLFRSLKLNYFNMKQQQTGEGISSRFRCSNHLFIKAKSKLSYWQFFVVGIGILLEKEWGDLEKRRIQKNNKKMRWQEREPHNLTRNEREKLRLKWRDAKRKYR
jgi:hypothetical protein